MADINDELDALFDDEPEEEEGSEEVEETEEAEKESEESEAAEESEEKPKAKVKSKAAIGKKTKGIGARTGAIAASKAKVGKTAGRGRKDLATKAKTKSKAAKPEPEPEAEEPVAGSRAKVVHAPTGSSGGGNGLLVVSLLLNVVLLLLVIVTLVKASSAESGIENLTTRMSNVEKRVVQTLNCSRAKIGVYTDDGKDKAVLVFLPDDVTKWKKESQVSSEFLENLDR